MQVPPLSASRASTSSGTLRGWSQTRVGRGVAEDHRGAGGVESVAHHVVADVGEVDQHPDRVHLADDVAADVAQPAEHRRVRGGVGPRHVVVVGQRQVADAEPVVHPQHRGRLRDLVAALGAHQAGDPAVAPGPPRPRRPWSPSARRSAYRSIMAYAASTCSSVVVTARSPSCARDEHRPELRARRRPHAGEAGRSASGPAAPPRRRPRSRSRSGRASPTGGRCARRSTG